MVRSARRTRSCRPRPSSSIRSPSSRRTAPRSKPIRPSTKRSRKHPAGQRAETFLQEHPVLPLSRHLAFPSGTDWRKSGGRAAHVAPAGANREAVAGCLTELPNGGLALYYPRPFDHPLPDQRVSLQRHRARKAAGRLLALHPRRRAQEACAGLACGCARHRQIASVPFEQGGVCVDGKIILEAPNYRSCPETVLNGWIDVLLHLYDYLQIVPNVGIE